MLHWHANTCRKPDIAAVGGTVYCARCERLSPSITSAAEKSTSEPVKWASSIPLDLVWPSPELYTEKCVLEKDGQDLTADLHHSLGFDSTHITCSTHAIRKISTSEGFSPLPVTDTIRILILSPGVEDDPLHGTLELLALKSDNDFEAVSYTWATEDGNVALSQPLFLGPAWDILPITNNCRNALRRLRWPDRPRKLWVDAICIDQGNPTEQGHQVGMMKRIYSSAKRCLIYLGEHNESSKRAMKSLGNIYHDPNYSNDDLERVSILFGRRYFTRLWVLQEILLARDVLVHCGDDALSWNRLIASLKSRFPQAAAPAWVKNFVWFRANGADDFTRLLFETSQTLTSDPRDRIFALFGILWDLNREGLIADYNIPFEKIYVGVATYIARKYGLRRILYIREEFDDDNASNLPSWVPDWRKTIAWQWSMDRGGVLDRLWDGFGPVGCVSTVKLQSPGKHLCKQFELHKDTRGFILGEQFKVHKTTCGLIMSPVFMLDSVEFLQGSSFRSLDTPGRPRRYIVKPLLGSPALDEFWWVLVSSIPPECVLTKGTRLALCYESKVFLILRPCQFPGSFIITGYCSLSMFRGIGNGNFQETRSFHLGSLPYFAPNLNSCLLGSTAWIGLWASASSNGAKVLWDAYYQGLKASDAEYGNECSGTFTDWTYESSISDTHPLFIQACDNFKRLCDDTSWPDVARRISSTPRESLGESELNLRNFIEFFRFWGGARPWEIISVMVRPENRLFHIVTMLREAISHAQSQEWGRESSSDISFKPPFQEEPLGPEVHYVGGPNIPQDTSLEPSLIDRTESLKERLSLIRSKRVNKGGPSDYYMPDSGCQFTVEPYEWVQTAANIILIATDITSLRGDEFEEEMVCLLKVMRNEIALRAPLTFSEPSPKAPKEETARILWEIHKQLQLFPPGGALRLKVSRPGVSPLGTRRRNGFLVGARYKPERYSGNPCRETRGQGCGSCDESSRNASSKDCCNESSP